MLGGLARADQRATGEVYLRGLMLDGKRKSMQPMAARLDVDHQRLQQFITSSTWDHVEVRSGSPGGPILSSFLTPMSSTTPVSQGWLGFAVRGPDVFRDAGQGRELSDRGQRARGDRRWLRRRSIGPCSCRSPGTTPRSPRPRRSQRSSRAGHAAGFPISPAPEKWRLALEMLDQIICVRDTGPDPEPEARSARGAGLGLASATRRGRRRVRRHHRVPRRPGTAGPAYVVAVKGSTSAYPAAAVPTAPAYSGRGRPPKPRYRDDPSNLTALALAAGPNALQHLTWRHGSR